MAPEDLSAPLAERDFREVETDFPGDWATNESQTIQITSEYDITGTERYIARVYDAPADALELPRVRRLAESVHHVDHVAATRLALERVGSEGGDC